MGENAIRGNQYLWNNILSAGLKQEKAM